MAKLAQRSPGPGEEAAEGAVRGGLVGPMVMDTEDIPEEALKEG